MHSIDQARQIQIVVKSALGAGKTAIAAVIANALKDTIPHCDITMFEEGNPVDLTMAKDITQKVRAIKPEEFFAYRFEIDTKEIPEM